MTTASSSFSLAALQHAIDFKTKPRGALGRLEELAAQIGQIQSSLQPQLVDPYIIVFAADHGASRSAISAYPREVTAQMVYGVLAGGAGISVFARQHGIELLVVDAGVDWEAAPEGVIDARIGRGTASYLEGDAMTAEQVGACLDAGRRVVEQSVPAATTVVGFGEIGIGNTSSAALLMSSLTGKPMAECAGPGTGLTGPALDTKIALLDAARAAHPVPRDAREALSFFGGFEIAQMTGAMLAAYDRGQILLIDGFVASAAYLCAQSIQPAIASHAVFCHQSDEPGHQRLLEYLGARPLLQLNMRLGEGSGCAVAYPILVSAVNFLCEMASFEEAGVSTGAPEAADE